MTDIDIGQPSDPNEDEYEQIEIEGPVLDPSEPEPESPKNDEVGE